MSEQNPITLFVTHGFMEHEEYSQVFEYLESRDNFFYVNKSVVDNKPDFGQEAVQEEIRRQIKDAEIVLFPLGTRAADPQLVDFQILVAKAFDRPVLAIKSHAGEQDIPQETLDQVTETVDWNDRAITDAIRRLARGEDTSSWDVIEFDLGDDEIPDLPKK
jgi:hypothetical protein